MKVLLKLAGSFLREHPLRIALTSLATIASACMVVWVVSGYDALLASFDTFSREALGKYSLSVAPINDFRQYAPGDLPRPSIKYVSSDVVEDLRADPMVTAADPMWTGRVPLKKKPGVERGAMAGPRGPTRPRPGAGAPGTDGERAAPGRGDGARTRRARGRRRRRQEARLLGTDAQAAPFELTQGRWFGTEPADVPQAVLSADVSEGLGIAVGDRVLAGRDEHQLELEIIGVVDTPKVADVYGNIAASQLLSPNVGGLYVRMAQAEVILGEPRKISFIGVSVAEDADITEFRFGWTHRLSRYRTPVQFQEAYEIEEALDDSASAENIRMQAWFATGIALLAALFIIWSTLSMGVAERIRQLALLRAVALTRSQVATLVLLEGFVLGTIGFVGGIAAGALLLQVAAESSPNVVARAGATLGPNSLVLAAVCAYGGALLAAALPAHRATRVRPTEAMNPHTSHGGDGVSWPLALLGLALIAVNPLITFVAPIADGEGRYVVYMLLGCTAMAAGFILLAPAVVTFADRALGPVVAKLMGLERGLLKHQITTRLWSTVGTAIAMTIGLGLYFGIQVWGATMVTAFMPGDWAPDALMGFSPQGIDLAEAKKLEQLEGIRAGRSFPIVSEQPRLLRDLTNSAERASVTRQDSIVLVGIDARAALAGEDPFLDFEWVKGDAKSAAEAMASGRGCIVPDHFLWETGLEVGDSFELVPPADPDHPVAYTVAAAVRLPGWHWQTKPTGFRSRTHRAAALVFADYAPVAGDFSRSRASHVWFDFDAEATDRERLTQGARQLYSEALDAPVAVGGAPGDKPFVKYMPIAGIRRMVASHAERWIWGMSKLPLVLLLVAALGVLNAILASVRARRWDFGVLRSIGCTRSRLVRLVMAEGILIGLVACILSVGFGLVSGWCAAGISQYVSFFGGMHPALDIPWAALALGLAGAVGLAALATVWPALSIGRAEPLKLLQQGRSAQ